MLLRAKIPQRKKGFSALCIFDIGGDENLSWLCTALDANRLAWAPLERLTPCYQNINIHNLSHEFLKNV